jgi:outer membrane receptor protein involved in Fe transport
LGWGELYSSTSFLNDKTRIQVPLTPFFQPFVEAVASTVAGTAIDFRDPFRTDERNKSDTFTQEARISSSGDGRFNYLVGVYYTDGESVGSAPAVQPGLAPYNTPLAGMLGLTGDGTDTAFDFSGAGDFKELAGFGEMRWSLADDKVEMTLGGRLFKAESTGIDADGNITSSASETDTIFRGALAWLPNDNLTVFGQISQGYRAGGGNTQIPDPPANFDDSFDADTLTNYEIGVKTRTANDRLAASVSVYFIDWEDIQTQFTSPGGFLYGDNAGAAETSGVEIELTANPWSNAILAASAAYLKAELTEDVPGAGLVNGQRLPGTPEYTASLNLRQRFAIGGDYSLEPAVFWTYRDESYAGFGATQGQLLDAYSRLNLSLLLANEMSKWDFRLFVDNVTDERPTLAHYGFRGVPQIVTIRPLTYGLTFTKNWD